MGFIKLTKHRRHLQGSLSPTSPEVQNGEGGQGPGAGEGAGALPFDGLDKAPSAPYDDTLSLESPGAGEGPKHFRLSGEDIGDEDREEASSTSSSPVGMGPRLLLLMRRWSKGASLQKRSRLYAEQSIRRKR